MCHRSCMWSVSLGYIILLKYFFITLVSSRLNHTASINIFFKDNHNVAPRGRLHPKPRFNPRPLARRSIPCLSAVSPHEMSESLS
jgi:hypothetical protein